MAGLHARFGGRAGRLRGIRRGKPWAQASLEPLRLALALGAPQTDDLSAGAADGSEAEPGEVIASPASESESSELQESTASELLAPVSEEEEIVDGPLLPALEIAADPAVVVAAPGADQALSPEHTPSAVEGVSLDGASPEPSSNQPSSDQQSSEQPSRVDAPGENSAGEKSAADAGSVADPGTPANDTTADPAPGEVEPGAVQPDEVEPVDAQPVVEPPVVEPPVGELTPPEPAVEAPPLAEPLPSVAEPELLNADAELPHLELENTVVAQWNELALQAIREDKPVPTVITRSLHLAHAAMYDAWAAFDADAAGAYFNPRAAHRRARRRIAEDTLERAVSTAAHHTLSQLFPSHTDRFDALLQQLGVAGRRDPASRMGLRAARTVLRHRANDGSNARNDYADTSGYASMNAPDDPDLDPNYWTPLKVPNGSSVDENGIPVVTADPSSYDVQAPLTPHWGQVDPFALNSGRDFRPVAPPKLGDFSPYTDAWGEVSTNDAAYRRQFTDVAELSAALTPEQKVIAEYWADGPKSSTPPGHWNEFAQDIALREEHGLEQDVKLFFALNNALMDTGIAIWDAKYAHDYVRPQTAIRYLFSDEEIAAWAGPNQGTQMIPGSTWQPYQDVTFVTPAFPEYTSGHSGFSYAAASVLEAFTGSDVLFDGTSRGAQDLDGDGQPDLIGSYRTDALTFEQYDGDPITLQWSTVWEAAAEAGRSRLYGGIHIQDGDLRARAMGKAVAEVAWDASEALFTAGQGRRWRRRRRLARLGRRQRLEPLSRGFASIVEEALTTASDELSSVSGAASEAASEALNAALNLHSTVESYLD